MNRDSPFRVVTSGGILATSAADSGGPPSLYPRSQFLHHPLLRPGRIHESTNRSQPSSGREWATFNREKFVAVWQNTPRPPPGVRVLQPPKGLPGSAPSACKATDIFLLLQSCHGFIRTRTTGAGPFDLIRKFSCFKLKWTFVKEKLFVVPCVRVFH